MSGFVVGPAGCVGRSRLSSGAFCVVAPAIRCGAAVPPTPKPSDIDADEEDEGEEGGRALGDESAEDGDEGADGISSY